jgi:hypothetical protein
MSLDLNAVMNAVGVRLATIPGVRVYDFPPDSVAIPAAVVSYPEEITYDETMARGTDSCVLTVAVLVGKESDRASRDALAAYVAGTGASSVKTAVDGTLAGAVKDACVSRAVFRPVLVGGVEYRGAIFEVEVYA